MRQKKAVTRENLPVGGYVAKILNAEEISYSWGAVLLVSFDISEGQYKDFFANDYKGQDREDKKWRGTYRLRILTMTEASKTAGLKDHSTMPCTVSRTETLVITGTGTRTTLKGKTVGVLFRNKEWEKDSKTGWFTECCALACIGDIRDGNFKTPKDKPLKDKETSSGGFAEIPSSPDSDLPF